MLHKQIQFNNLNYSYNAQRKKNITNNSWGEKIHKLKKKQTVFYILISVLSFLLLRITLT